MRRLNLEMTAADSKAVRGGQITLTVHTARDGHEGYLARIDGFGGKGPTPRLAIEDARNAACPGWPS